MSFNLGTLWNTLNSIVSSINSFFDSIFSSATAITNTGQGVFTGLATFGSSLWDAINNLATEFYNAITQGLATFGSWISTAYTALADGLTSAFNQLGQAVQNFGNWLYNGLSYIIQVAITLLQDIWNGIVGVFNFIWNSLNGAFSALAGAANSYFNGILTTWRNKVKSMLIVDMAIQAGYPALRDLPTKLTDAFMSDKSDSQIFKTIGGAFAAPIIGALGGAIFAELLDALLGLGTPNVTLIHAPQVQSLSLAPTPFRTVSAPSAPSGISGSGFGLPNSKSITETLSYSVTTNSSHGSSTTESISYMASAAYPPSGSASPSESISYMASAM